MSTIHHTIQGKVVLVTGCVSGIGLSIVDQLLTYDVKGLFLLDKQENKGKVLEERISKDHQNVQVKFRKCDLNEDSEVVAAYYEGWLHFGHIDVVINNAGIVNESKWKEVIKVNQLAVIESSLQAWKRMRADHGGIGGTIINVASIQSVLPLPALPVYCGTKAAVKLFSESLGDPFHFNRTHVRVITVCPMLTDTAILNGIENMTIDSESADYMIGMLDGIAKFSSDDVAKSILEVYRTGTSGTSWIVTDRIEKIPPADITLH